MQPDSSAGSKARTRPVVVTTLTVRPRKPGDFQPLRLIHESRMPASAIRVTGASSRGAYSPRPAQVASSQPNGDSGDVPQRRGTVVLDVTVTKNGAVEEVRVVSGDPLLAEAAKAAVANWRYQPATMDGTPVQGNARVTVRFQPSDNNQ
jgi:TonB family protein